MATVALLANPPVAGSVLPDIVDETPLIAEEAARLYSAMLVDASRAVQDSGADLLVNYLPADETAGETDPEQDLRDLLGETLERPGEARYEVQVGSSYSARVGNTVTHLLEEEGEKTVSVVRPTAPFLSRAVVGGAAMKLRSSDVVLGPTTRGRVYFAGFGDPVDFEGAFEAPAVETLADRASQANLDVDFIETLPVVEDESDMVNALANLRARQRAERAVPAHTAAVLDELDITLVPEDGGLVVGRSSDNS